MLASLVRDVMHLRFRDVVLNIPLCVQIFRKEPFFHGHDNVDQVHTISFIVVPHMP